MVQVKSDLLALIGGDSSDEDSDDSDDDSEDSSVGTLWEYMHVVASSARSSS